MNKGTKILLKMSKRPTFPNIFKIVIAALNEVNPDIGDLIRLQRMCLNLKRLESMQPDSLDSLDSLCLLDMLKFSRLGIKGIWGIIKLFVKENGLFSSIFEAGRIFKDLLDYNAIPGLKEHLFRICINRNHEKLSRLLSKTINLDVVYKDGSTPATLAVEKGRCDVLKIMLNRDSNVRQGNRDELEPVLDHVHQEPENEYNAYELLRQTDGKNRNLVAIAMDHGGDKLKELLMEMRKAYTHHLITTSNNYWDSITTINPFEEAEQYFKSVGRRPLNPNVLSRFVEETTTADPIKKSFQRFIYLKGLEYEKNNINPNERISLDELKAIVEIVKSNNKKGVFSEFCKFVKHVTSINTNPGFKEKLFRFCIEHSFHRMTKWLCKIVKLVVTYKDGKTLGSLIVEYDRLDELNIILNRSAVEMNNESTDSLKNYELFDFLNQKALNGQVNLVTQVLLRNGQNRGSMLKAMKLAYLQNTTREQKLANLNPFVQARSELTRAYAELEAIIDDTVLDIPCTIFQSNNPVIKIITKLVINASKKGRSPKFEAKSSTNSIELVEISKDEISQYINTTIELAEIGKDEISKAMNKVKEELIKVGQEGLLKVENIQDRTANLELLSKKLIKVNQLMNEYYANIKEIEDIILISNNVIKDIHIKRIVQIAKDEAIELVGQVSQSRTSSIVVDIENFIRKDMVESYNQLSEKINRIKMNIRQNIGHLDQMKMSVKPRRFFESLELPENIKKNIARKIEQAQNGQVELEDIEDANGTVNVIIDKDGNCEMMIDYPDQSIMGWMWGQDNYVEKFITGVYVELNMYGILIEGNHVGQKISSIQISINTNSEKLKDVAKEINNVLNKMIKDRDLKLSYRANVSIAALEL